MTDVGPRASSIRDVWADVVAYILRRPPERTHVHLRTAADRDNYDARILQRLNIRVADYSVLNIHRIGIEAPTSLVWDLLTEWHPDRGYWPNALARAVLASDSPSHVRVFLLGRTRPVPFLPARLFGLEYVPLFRLDVVRQRAVPRVHDVDNARYLLYRCSGGYPIGIFSMYVRSRIAAQDERERTQLFFVVSFDFFGRKNWLGARAIRPLWESIHNRVTSHSLARFKAHCEAVFGRLQAGVAHH